MRIHYSKLQNYPLFNLAMNIDTCVSVCVWGEVVFIILNNNAALQNYVGKLKSDIDLTSLYIWLPWTSLSPKTTKNI